MTSKLPYWFKSYCDFAEWIIFPIGQSGEASRWRVCYQRGLNLFISLKKSKSLYIVYNIYNKLWQIPCLVLGNHPVDQKSYDLLTQIFKPW